MRKSFSTQSHFSAAGMVPEVGGSIDDGGPSTAVAGTGISEAEENRLFV